MGIAFMHIEKVKNAASLKGIYMHNYRVNQVANADKSLSHENEELVKLEGKDYYSVFKERLVMLEEMYPGKKIFRSNGTPAIEVLTSMPRSDMGHVDVEKWKEDNVAWLRKTFNRCPEKHGDNVISVMYHGDEMGSVHCHAIILPIDEKGKFNYSAFIDGQLDLKELQKSYGDLMEKEHGLQRGIEGSKAKHEDIRRLYTQLNQNLRVDDIPKPFENESQEEYLERIEEFFKDVRAGALKKQKDLEQEVHKYKTICQQKDIQIYKMEKERQETDYKYHCLIEKYAEGNEKEFLELLEKQAKISLCMKMGMDSEERRKFAAELEEAIAWSEEHLHPRLYETEIEIHSTEPITKEMDKDQEKAAEEPEIEIRQEYLF